MEDQAGADCLCRGGFVCHSLCDTSVMVGPRRHPLERTGQEVGRGQVSTTAMATASQLHSEF